ncbi:hypothetical protein HG530_009946 [Fusarium avenaceum]|nr:hypothetical protein HG530_009946 [Fusarium avenaceum]
MGAATNGNATVRPINNLLTSFNELPSIREPRRTICISEQDIFTSHVSETMRSRSTLASVACQRNNPENIMQTIFLCEFEHNIHCLISTSIVDD